jgi:hypothetical protein
VDESALRVMRPDGAKCRTKENASHRAEAEQDRNRGCCGGAVLFCTVPLSGRLSGRTSTRRIVPIEPRI